MALRVALAQLDPVVGDLSGNVDRVIDALRRAEGDGADVCVLPELVVTGYPPEDLLLKSGFVVDNLAAVRSVAAATDRCVAIVGFVEPLELRAVGAPASPDDGVEGTAAGAESLAPRSSGDRWGRMPAPAVGTAGGVWRGQEEPTRLANAAAICAGGEIVGIYRKHLLPNYSVFDEQRWFTPGSGSPTLYRIGGVRVGVSICEDIWADAGPVTALGRAGAELVVNLNASPYSRGRPAERLAMLTARAAEVGCPIVYVNQVGGQDELVFDGASVVLGADGTVLARGAQFREDLVVVDVPVEPGGATDAEVVDLARLPRPNGRPTRAAVPAPAAGPPPPLGPAAEVYGALVLGTRDYLVKNGFSGAVIGLSGGIDSSLVATIAVDALGPDQVHGIAMPSRYSSEGSIADARLLAERLGIDLQVVPIEPAHVAMSSMLGGVLDGGPRGLTDENLQSRLRGVLLMAVSNANGWIVLTTGNKSELATGYSTLYGDSVGGFAVIRDVPKTLVYELCRYRNEKAAADGRPEPVPRSVLEKPPSAELRPDQRDDQSLPAYELLDPVLEAYVERDRTAADLVADGFDPDLVGRVVRLVDRAEYKRRQMPPGVRISAKAFGKDRRMPITNGYLPGVSPTVAAGERPAPGPERPWRPAPPGGDEPGALTLHQAAALIGAYRWVEEQLFAVTGRWSVEAAMTPAGQVHLFEASRQHACHAELWAARLPLVAAVDHGALTRPLGSVLGPLLAALDGEADAVGRLAGLHRVVLAKLAATYRRHLARVVPVADRPVARVLRLALSDLDGEQAAGATVLGPLLAGEGGDAAGAVAERLEPLLAPAGDGCLVPWPGAAQAAPTGTATSVGNEIGRPRTGGRGGVSPELGV
ncbi:MAG: NAD+ synthase [Acidimicrobiales bacterium]